ncbi:MAG: hypothetical protein AAF456_19870 [Planctomycetota bacterium]
MRGLDSGQFAGLIISQPELAGNRLAFPETGPFGPNLSVNRGQFNAKTASQASAQVDRLTRRARNDRDENREFRIQFLITNSYGKKEKENQ